MQQSQVIPLNNVYSKLRQFPASVLGATEVGNFITIDGHKAIPTIRKHIRCSHETALIYIHPHWYPLRPVWMEFNLHSSTNL